MTKGPAPTPAEVRYRAKVDDTGGPGACWPWTAAVNRVTGYGVFHDATNKTVNAHRFGAVLAGIVSLDDQRHVDHTCHNDAGCPPGPCAHRRCQNPAHWEAVGGADNVNRSHNSNARKVRCPNGHRYTPENTRLQVSATTTKRACVACSQERN